MSAISDAIAAVNASADAEIARVGAKEDALRQQVIDLQAQIDAGTASQADIDALAAVKAKLDVIDLDNPATLAGLKAKKK